MQKLIKKLQHLPIELTKWSREVLFEHLVDVIKDIKQSERKKKSDKL